MNAEQLIERIYNTCLGTSENNITPNGSYEYWEAQRLDGVITEICQLCEDYIYAEDGN